MQLKPRHAWIVVLGIAASGTAMADAKIESVSATQSAPLEALVTVAVERTTPLDQYCDAIVDLGDGTSETLKYGVGDKRTKTLQHRYAKAGTYKVSVKGSGKCGGASETSVTVQAAAAKAAGKAAKPSCPKGWTVAADSVQGNRYTCRANPPAKAIKCAGDAQYFYDHGVIGCR